MRPQLKRLIVNARARLGGYALSANQEQENLREQALEDFKTFMAGKIDLSTSLELLLGGDYLWLESAPALRFAHDGHTFVLRRGDREILVLEQCHDEQVQIACLAADDLKFEDRLLVAIGSVLDPVRQ